MFEQDPGLLGNKQEIGSEAIPNIDFLGARRFTDRSEGFEKVLEFVTLLENSVRDETLYIDKGGAGKVFKVAGTGFCVKVVHDRPVANEDGIIYNVGNSATEEARYQMKVQSLQARGARAPVCMTVIPGEAFSAIVMEEVDGVNLARVLAGIDSLPDAFDYDVFFSALEEYIHMMHNQYHVYHGDLKGRNIMVDRVTGLPFIIDFGRSGMLPTQQEKSREKREVDWQEYDLLEGEISTYLENLHK